MQGCNTDGDVLITEEPQNEIVSPGAQPEHEKCRLKLTARKDNLSKKLERHTVSLWLASSFAIASIFIWAIACTLTYKPVQFETYFDTTGRFSRGQFEQNDRWRRVSRVGLQVLGTLSIPLTSAVCARAVVVYCQRSSNKRQPAISMRQTLVLADKGWMDLNTWMNLFGPMGGRIYSPLLILSMLLCALGKNMLSSSESTMMLIFLQAFAISILQGAFIDTISITVMTIADTYTEYSYAVARSKDPLLTSIVGTTPSMLNGNEEVYLPSVIEATIAGKAGDLQPNLWVIGQNSSNLTSMDSFYTGNGYSGFDSIEEAYKEDYNMRVKLLQTGFKAKPFFTSSLTVGTDTGILKALALRMSTSLQCQDIIQAEFPSDCNETASLAMNFTNIQFQGRDDDYRSDTYYIAPIFSFHICSPGAKNWTRDNDSTHNIREELYMDLQTWPSNATEHASASAIPIRYNFTYHCIADSNLAYFEPMNEWNGHQVQDRVDIKAKDVSQFTGPNKLSNTHGLIYSPAAPGPLATTIRALFGDNTFFNSIVKANDTRGANLDICRAIRMPLTGLCTYRGTLRFMCNPYGFQSGSTLNCIKPSNMEYFVSRDDDYPRGYGPSNFTASSGTLAYFLYMWLQKFNNWNSTMAALTFTNFYSARAILDPSRGEHLLGTFDNYTQFALPIYSSPGLRIQKLHIPFSAIVIISVLMLLQIAGLLALGVYTSMQPTWTVSLDGFALLRMGKAMRDELPLISTADAKEADVLDATEGWIGDEERDENEEGDRNEDEDEGKVVGGRLLQVGGSGRVILNARYRTKREPEYHSLVERFDV